MGTPQRYPYAVAAVRDSTTSLTPQGFFGTVVDVLLEKIYELLLHLRYPDSNYSKKEAKERYEKVTSEF